VVAARVPRLAVPGGAAVVAASLLLAWAPLPGAFVERWYTAGFYARLQPIVTGRITADQRPLAVASHHSPTRPASFCTVERPSRCNAARILTSIRSSAGGRRTAMGAPRVGTRNCIRKSVA